MHQRALLDLNPYLKYFVFSALAEILSFPCFLGRLLYSTFTLLANKNIQAAFYRKSGHMTPAQLRVFIFSHSDVELLFCLGSCFMT